MVDIGEVHFRALYIIFGVGVLALLRKPIRYPDRPGSRWLAVTIGGLSLWLVAVGLYYVATTIETALVLYNLVLFAVTICFVGWLLIAVEFATGESPPRSILYGLGAFAVVHFVLLWTNYLWLHELVYGADAFVDAGGGLNVPRGPLFWVHIVSVYLLLFASTVLFVAEWVNSSGLRRRQAGIFALTPTFGVGSSVLWFAEVLPFPYDPTPVGVTAGVVVLTWALYRAEFLEVVPIGRQAVVSEMTDGVVMLDDSDRVVDWNDAARTMFEPEDPSVGMAAEAKNASVPSSTLSRFAGRSQSETQVSVEMDGRERHFSVVLSTVEADDTRSLGRVVVIRDITALKRREQQLLEQNEYLDEFASVVSHDLQGPLMQIRASADRATRSGDVEHVEDVADAADRMERLTDDLLELARSGQQIAEVEPVDLAAVAESAWQRIWTGDAEFVVEGDDTVIADPDRVGQLLENLFRNSVEHNPQAKLTESTRSPAKTDHGGDYDGLTVRIGMLPDGFYVEDDGSGITAADSDRIFERGYTTDDGAGFGLSIVRQIVRAHGWSIHVTDGIEGGARFEITGVEFD